MSMRALHIALLPTALALAVASTPSSAQEPAATGTLTAFGSEGELAEYLEFLRAERARLVAEEQARLAKASRCEADIVANRHRQGGQRASAPAVLRGRVVTLDGEPLPGVSITVRGMQLGVVTRDSGEFRLVIPPDGLARSRRLEILARRIGFTGRQHELTVARGDSIELRIPLCAMVMRLSEVTVSQPASANLVAQDAITNVQHAGVDEGGIVKLHGDHLVVLRRGRLFTIDVGDDALRPVAAVNAFGPDVSPQWDWYDEMLIHGDKVVVIGYSYSRGGTEIVTFRIDRNGRLRYLSTNHLRSHDYYSSRNYASRLIGSTLVFYTPLYLWGSEDPLEALPAMRRWRRGGERDAFQPITPPRRIYRAARAIEDPRQLTLHTVTRCDLAAPELECEATTVLGPPGRTFYVSPSAVYVWTSGWKRLAEEASAPAQLYRMPLDGSAPSAIAAAGAPVDQFSFLEANEQLNVVVRPGSAGDAMWMPEFSRGGVSLLRVPLASFGDGTQAVPADAYRRLPRPGKGVLQNRFVGEALLYGSGSGWGGPRQGLSVLQVVPLDGGDIRSLALEHAADRIDAMGRDAIVIGTDGSDLHFTGIRLGDSVDVVQHHVVPSASQGELRSHGFFYRNDGRDAGVLGLPIRGAADPGWRHLIDESASIVFLRNDGRDFHELGKLDARAEAQVVGKDDGCVASCVDWYGNARPLFLRGRTFALLGYELVEGRIDGGGMREVRRTSFAPGEKRD